ncbi:hypothetical protein HK098_003213 [Nowakowskiella sp. JEL0407]|nr:hypothetical protein HK098_003213 [Nowakowskiella sp. JEL0407]
MLFLLSTYLLCFYASYLVFRILQGELETRGLKYYKTFDQQRGQQVYISRRDQWMVPNETFKWDDLSYTIKKEKVIEIEKDLYDYNQSFSKKSKPPVDIISQTSSKKKKKIAGSNNEEVKEFVEIRKVSELKNIYDKGIWKNLNELLFPKPI